MARSPRSLARLRLRRLIRKELIQLLRDRRSLFMLFISPILQLLVYGYAVTTEVRHVATIVLDRDQTTASRAIVDAVEATGDFRIVQRAATPADEAHALDRGSAVLAIDVPVGFERALVRGTPIPVQVLIDGTSANTASVAQGYVTQIVQAQGATAVVRATGVAASSLPIRFEPRVWYNPGLESRVYFVPATGGVIILDLGLMLTALAIVREREQGTLEQLLVSPLTPLEIILGKTLPVALVVMADVATVDLLGVTWFHVPFEGGLVLLAASSLTFVLAGLGAGVLISTIARTQQESSMSMAPIMAPVMMLSGMIFPISSMPRVVQWLTYLNPLRYQIVVLRSLFLKGAGIAALWPQLLPMAAMAVALMLVAARRFQRRLA